MIRTFILFAAFALLLAPLSAQSKPFVGKKAPELPPVENWINPPWYSSLADLRGEVVLIKSWGID